MCSGFKCTKYVLTFLNVAYLLISFLLIGIASYAKAAAFITSFEIAGGIIASGLFLFFIAFFGLIAVSKHHQVLLFFYIIVLFVLFIIQFSVSIACLAVSREQVTSTIKQHWGGLNDTSSLKDDAQKNFACCGWDWNQTTCLLHIDYCQKFCVCDGNKTANTENLKVCEPCENKIPKTISGLLKSTGEIGLFFSFTEILGVWLAIRYRNQKNPYANPDQFL